MCVRNLCLVSLAFFIAVTAARGQSYSGDARKIGMGGIGYSENITSKMIEDDREYGAFVIPLGLIQLLSDRDRFDPDNDDFDPVLAMEYAANPIHFVFGRDSGDARGRFVSDIVDGKLSADLNDYRGFVPTNSLMAEGLASPNWGKTFKFRRRPDGSFQGFYIGVGPYISAKTDLTIDAALSEILGSATDVYRPNESIPITDRSTGQLALAVTGGYRARFALPGAQSDSSAGRNGIYIGVNYHYLRGFRYEDADLDIRFVTDAEGMVTLNPEEAPVVVTYNNARYGSGFALDFGIGAVVDRWEFGFGANGVGNRINWEDFSLKEWRLENWSEEGSDFIEHALEPEVGKLRVELPVEYIGNAAYHLQRWTFAAEVSNGFQGTSFHAGAEYRWKILEFRGGGRYGLDRWHPSGGIGLNLGRRFAVDVAAFGTTTNIERELKPGMAISLRFNRIGPEN